MSDAPERIWAYPSYVTGWDSAIAHNRPIVDAHGYIRKDLYDALAKDRDELAGEVERLEEVRGNLARIAKIHLDERNAEFHRAEKAEAEVERLREAIVSLRLDDDKREFDAFDSGWNAALDALQRKEGNE